MCDLVALKLISVQAPWRRAALGLGEASGSAAPMPQSDTDDTSCRSVPTSPPTDPVGAPADEGVRLLGDRPAPGGPQGQSENSPSSSDNEALPPTPFGRPLPPELNLLSRKLQPIASSGLSPRARVARAYRAGERALAALDAGDADRGERTPDCGLDSRSYVLLRPASEAGGRPTAVTRRTQRELRQAAGGDFDRDTLVHHGFPSESESSAYCWGAMAASAFLAARPTPDVLDRTPVQ